MANINSNFESLNKEEMQEFAGKWVAVIDNKIAASGNTFKEVYMYVKKNHPNKRPLIGKIPESIPIVLHSIK